MNITNISTLKPFGRFCVSLGMIPTSYKESMSYEEQLLWFCNYLETEVIPKYNENVEAINELIVLYNQLREYVENYFENLDVQEEINNKLDEMAESGELEEIIAQYLQLSSVLGFDTIQAMSEASNIVEGNICYTTGQLTYDDGKCGFYKIRTVTSGDVIDGFNIVALDASDTLIAERLSNYYINEINSSISSFNEDIEDINNELINIQTNKNIDPKFVANPRSYFSDLDITGTNAGLSFEVFYRMSNTSISIQGVAVNKATGDLLYCNESEIYKLSNTAVPVKTTLWSGDYGHGGDCCILNNKMYISDSTNNAIHVVNLSNGSKVSYTLDNTKIVNPEHNDYTPIIGGICMDNDESYCYIGIIDDENNDHTVKPGATIRVYKYDFNNTYTKVFEKTQDICYLQGLTKDKDYFYYVGNKPFTSNYAGSKLYIIDTYNYNTYDVLENSINYEYEGLDYGSINGCEGLITTTAHSGANTYYGLFSFNGNVTETITFKNTTNEKAYSVKSRGGTVTTYVKLTGTFAQDSTYTYDNFFNNNYPFKGGAGGGQIVLLALAYSGSNRNHIGQGEWDYVNDRLTIRTLTTTTSSTDLKLTFVYTTD